METKSKTETCYKCKRKVYFYLEGIPICAKHIITDYYSKNKGCMEAYLDCLEHSENVGKKEIPFLREVKKKYPYVVNLFPKLFGRKKKAK